MLLSGVLFALFLAGCWIYCLTDAALMPAEAYPGWRKHTWVTIISLTFVFGAAAWVIARHTWQIRYWPPAVSGGPALAGTTWHPGRPAESAADAALARHPAGRARASRPESPGVIERSGRPARSGGSVPKGPDDDIEFLRQLDRRIRGSDTGLTD